MIVVKLTNFTLDTDKYLISNKREMVVGVERGVACSVCGLDKLQTEFRFDSMLFEHISS